ncbi:MAG: hypothetical protein EXS03_07280 [Phycisphaerales bacterium]|nr:hypothetical protein [Phycisphaerales bacterium]
MPSDSNLSGLDFRAEAARLGVPPVPIIDAHAHIVGTRAARILLEVMDLYGIAEIWSMTPSLTEVEAMRDLFGQRIRFIAVPDWRSPDRRSTHGEGYARRIEEMHTRGARIAKFWAAPRGVDMGHEVGDGALMRLDNPVRIAAMQRAYDLGMSFMVHVADPDTWFATKYADASRYGTKASQYEPFEQAVDRFDAPWIAAHMGGWPEDLAFLDGLLSRHHNLWLDTSATKWVVREVSRHPREEVHAFFSKWRHRLLFGSDIVTSDAHLSDEPSKFDMDRKASSADAAFELYASRYWALRTLWESSWEGPSPIADPDLALVDPARFTVRDSPTLRGVALPGDLLHLLYAGNARDFSGRSASGYSS